MNLANRRGDIILHVNPRINDRQLVLNAAPGGAWGGEDRKPLTIQRGQQFSIIIMVTEHAFKVKEKSHIEIFFFSNRFFFRLQLITNILLIFIIVCPSMQLI